MDRKVFVLTGNTGTGKTTVANYLNEFYEMPQVITHTTRPPREGEIDQVDYYFETAQSFQDNHYLESVSYANYQYGSSYEGLERAWQKNPLITIVLDTAGAKTYAEKLGDTAVIIFLTVTKTVDLLGRLSKRGDNLEEMQQRLSSEEYQRDIKLPQSLQGIAHVIVNDDWQNAKAEIDHIVKQAVVNDLKEE